MGFENSIENKLSMEQDKKNKKHSKKESKSKQVYVYTLDFIDCLKEDERIQYPFHITVFDKTGAGLRIIQNDKELDSFCKWFAVSRSNVMRASWPRQEVHMDISIGGRFTLDKDFLPEVKHLDTLTPEEVKTLYDKIMN